MKSMPPDLPTDDGAPRDPPAVPALDYCAPHTDLPAREKEFGATMGAGILAATTVWCLVYGWLGGIMAGGLFWAIPCLATPVAVVFWVGFLYSRRKSRPIMLGSMIGFGVAIYIASACFGRVWK
jgi:hypothetical protein